MKASVKKHTFDTINAIAITCNTIIEFKKKSQSAYNAARNLGILGQVSSHMVSGRVIKWTKEKILSVALEYDNPFNFQKSAKNAYQAAITMGVLKDACAHMTRLCREPYNRENLKPIIAKYSNVGDFRAKDPIAYAAMAKLGLLEELTADLARERSYWRDEDLFVKAAAYETRGEFREFDSSAYGTCINRGILEKACSNMKRSGGTSSQEFRIMACTINFFPEAKRYKTNKVHIEGKPHIKGFEIDIFVPNLKKGIEFDGTYYHSFKGLKRSRKHWPDDDIHNYHDIKDEYFLSQGIQILHIEEREWINNRASCVAQIEQFLGITGFMSESVQKAA